MPTDRTAGAEMLAELLRSNPHVRVTFSQWCSSGYTGKDKCMCGRCLVGRGLPSNPMTEMQARLDAAKADAAYRKWALGRIRYAD